MLSSSENQDKSLYNDTSMPWAYAKPSQFSRAVEGVHEQWRGKYHPPTPAMKSALVRGKWPCERWEIVTICERWEGSGQFPKSLFHERVLSIVLWALLTSWQCRPESTALYLVVEDGKPCWDIRVEEKREVWMEVLLLSANRGKNPVLLNSNPNYFPIAIESKVLHTAMACNTILWTKLCSCSQNTLVFCQAQDKHLIICNESCRQSFSLHSKCFSPVLRK